VLPSELDDIARVVADERAAEITPFRVALALLTALALCVFGVSWKRRMGPLMHGPRGRVALRLFGLSVLGVGCVWSSYLGAFYYPMRSQALRHIARELAAMPER